MNYLQYVLIFNIALTLCVFSLPLMLLPSRWLDGPGFRFSSFDRRLLGAAYLSLALGYFLGLAHSFEGVYPADNIYVGILSNGLATLVLTGWLVSGRLSDWGRFARCLLAVSALRTGAVTLGLLLFGVLAFRA